MAQSSPPSLSRLVSERYPPPGQDEAADAIYARRGSRGLTSLDANLLNAPQIALGYSSLLGAIRTKGKLAGDIREAMILRIAALNNAAYEWIHHVELGRKNGLTTGQLYIIRDIDTPLVLPRSRLLGPLMTAALMFTDESTRRVKVSMEVCERFKEEIEKSLLVGEVDEIYVEAAMVVGTYNMVSRFLISTDVGGMSDVDVPWPVERDERFVSIPSFPPLKEPMHQIHSIMLRTSVDAPWLVFSNGLNTDWRVWSFVIPILLDHGEGFNILLHSQRGHGLSTLPPPTEGQERLTTIPLLAMDIYHLLEELEIPTPVRSVIGVSQGGATTLGFAALYGEKTRSVVVCDTAAATAPGNMGAWELRTRAVCGSSGDEWWKGNGNVDMEAYAEKVGMGKLAKITLPRWFPEGSACHPGSELDSRVEWMEEMIEGTSVRGFYHGAKALGSYDVYEISEKRLFDTGVEKVLLVAGSLDGGGRVGKGMRRLKDEWQSCAVEYVEIGSSGHLPMIDCPDVFSDLVLSFLDSNNN